MSIQNNQAADTEFSLLLIIVINKCNESITFLFDPPRFSAVELGLCCVVCHSILLCCQCNVVNKMLRSYYDRPLKISCHLDIVIGCQNSISFQ